MTLLVIFFSSILSLSNQAASFLDYYSPVILKEANESQPKLAGIDMISNYFFDDQVVNNNATNWLNTKYRIQKNIQPTLYTFAIKYRDRKTNEYKWYLVYHVYHPMQEGSIHDWERIEICVSPKGNTPSKKDSINYAVITQHSLHNSKPGNSSNLLFQQNKKGKHLVVWQARWDGSKENNDIRKAELHFVPKMDIYNNNQLLINGKPHYYHYIFNPKNNQFPPSQNGFAKKPYNKPIKNPINKEYKLANIADIYPSMLDSSQWMKPVQVYFETPIIDSKNKMLSTKGTKTLYSQAIIDNSPDYRQNYIHKHWFWGVYPLNSTSFSQYQLLIKTNKGLKQHQYFAHNGIELKNKTITEFLTTGVFLGQGEYSDWPQDDEFDGRWVHIFK